ncbi:MAG: hypothetical protein KME10_07710 [Plectolyngbya sp. WJT66-NPBG17]|nr:hypothetical protein [Plectolyngbya sp. WJT66-NPBG17]
MLSFVLTIEPGRLDPVPAVEKRLRADSLISEFTVCNVEHQMKSAHAYSWGKGGQPPIYLT